MAETMISSWGNMMYEDIQIVMELPCVTWQKRTGIMKYGFMELLILTKSLFLSLFCRMASEKLESHKNVQGSGQK